LHPHQQHEPHADRRLARAPCCRGRGRHGRLGRSRFPGLRSVPVADREAVPWRREAFLAAWRSIGRDRYHPKHLFHRRMNGGQLTPDQVRGWVANRFYYQRCIPLKDAAILSNCPVREVRRSWIRRIIDQDGLKEGDGGIEAWLRLA